MLYNLYIYYCMYIIYLLCIYLYIAISVYITISVYILYLYKDILYIFHRKLQSIRQNYSMNPSVFRINCISTKSKYHWCPR